MKILKKITAFLSSMGFALALLALLVAACIAGSVISQGQAESYYTGSYSAFAASAILSLRLNDVFHSAWFILLTAALCINLMMCNLLRFPVMLRRMKAFKPQPAFDTAIEPDCETDAPEKLLQAMGFRNTETYTTDSGKRGIYASRFRIGVWGAWLTHLGILIIIIGFALGQITAEKYTVYGVAGQTKPVDGTSLEVTIENFSVDLREDDTVKQYTSLVTVTDTSTGESFSGETSVNHPLSKNGMKIYQNSTGWAADVMIYHNDELIQTEIVCAGEYTTVEAVDELYVVFRAFYPDYVTDSLGQPATASSRLKNPAYLYMLYYGSSVLGMNTLHPGEKITVNDYSIIFANPRQYSLLQLKTDRFTGIALAGGIIILAALMLAFYIRPEEMWAIQLEIGRWAVYGRSPKGGILFKEKLTEKSNALNNNDNQ